MEKVRRSLWYFLLLPVAMVMVSCGSQAQQSSQPDYQSVKTMVLDIMQTDDAKNAVVKMMKDEKFKESLVLDTSTIQSTLIQNMANPNHPQIKEAFESPKFTSALAKSMKEENKKLLKELMKDPEYQMMMLDIMKDPEFEKNMMTILKSSAYRKQTMQVMKEALESPLFQADMMKLMTKATEEMTKPKTKQQNKKNGGMDGSGGGDGGGR